MYRAWDGQICKICGNYDKTYYTAPDNLWNEVVPEGVNIVCLSCFDDLATDKGIEYEHLLDEVGFVGNKCNYKMTPIGRVVV